MQIHSEHDKGKLVTITRAYFDRLVKAEEELNNLTNHCMCGSPVEAHGIGDGHAPVSMADGYRHQSHHEAMRNGPVL